MYFLVVKGKKKNSAMLQKLIQFFPFKYVFRREDISK